MKENILVIDNSIVNQIEIKKILETSYQVLMARNNKQALEVLEKMKQDVDLIFWESHLMQEINQNILMKKELDKCLAEIPIIAIAENDNHGIQVQSIESGAVEVITSPFIPAIIRARVLNVLLRKGSTSEINNQIHMLEMKSELDGMTGLLNKSSAEEKINMELLHGKGKLNVLLIIDIDNFKQVNDTLGHQAGDYVILTISHLLQKMFRQSDILGRIGGDEFCVLMKNMPTMEIVYAKIRELYRIMKHKRNLEIPEYTSLSIGIATNEYKEINYSTLFSRADEALLSAKENGRAQYAEFGMTKQKEKKEIFSHGEHNIAPNGDRNECILIVEDEPISRNILLKEISHKYSVIMAKNGIEAIKQLQIHEEELMGIILDLKMPLMDGYQVLEQMKRNNRLKRIPVIISTAEDSKCSDLKTLTLGANAVTHKPFDKEVLLKQLDNLVDSYREYKTERKNYMLYKSLLGNKSNTFLCTYHFDKGKTEIGDNYLKYMLEDFPKILASYPFCVEKLVLPDDYEKAEHFFNDLEENELSSIEIKLKGRHAYYEWFEINKVINWDENGNPKSIIFMFVDIQYSVEAKQDLLFMAENDSMTQIPNMRTFYRNVDELLVNHSEQQFTMITMDIFRFSIVNKLFGFAEGDKIIKYVATKLQEVVEEYDYGTYGRAASDIFYICIPESVNIAEFMQIMQKIVNDYPLKIQIKLCFGIFKIEDTSMKIEDMIEHSTFARKRTKEAPVKTFQYYTENLRKRETFEAVAVAEMEEALQSEQFEVYYQPKYDIEQNEIIGAEALIRWNHPKEGYLSPAYFIPIFEQNGTCVELDYYVYEQVCRTIRRCLDEKKKIVPVSVNVSRWSLYNEDLLENIIRIVDKYKVPHEYIEFEITESAFVLEEMLLTYFSTTMREKGFKVLIDDFGSGYSSLNSLKDISVDILKIDIKFLPISKTEDKAEIVLSTIIDMGHRLGLEVIAEGVETAEQIDLLRKLGCRWVQGYFFYRPMPYAEFRKILDQ